MAIPAYLFTEEFLVDNIYNNFINRTGKPTFFYWKAENAIKIFKWKLATLYKQPAKQLSAERCVCKPFENFLLPEHPQLTS